MDNPWQSPEAPLEGEPASSGTGPLMPFEEPGRPLWPRIQETVALVLKDAAEAGRRLGAGRAVGPAVAFFACAGLPLQWISQILVVWRTPPDASQNEALFRFFHLPPQPAPTAEQLAAAKVFAWMGVAVAPLVMALSVLLIGLLAHLGLWLLKGLSEKRGLEVTYRALLYAAGATAWVGFLNAFLVFIPGFRVFHQVLSVGLGLGVLTFQGLVLGHAHGEKAWKGVLALLLPPLAILCLCACMLGGVMGLAGAMHR